MGGTSQGAPDGSSGPSKPRQVCTMATRTGSQLWKSYLSLTSVARVSCHFQCQGLRDSFPYLANMSSSMGPPKCPRLAPDLAAMASTLIHWKAGRDWAWWWNPTT